MRNGAGSCLWQATHRVAPGWGTPGGVRRDMRNGAGSCLWQATHQVAPGWGTPGGVRRDMRNGAGSCLRSEEHTSELQSLAYLVCRLLLEKKKKNKSQLNQLTSDYIALRWKQTQHRIMI